MSHTILLFSLPYSLFPFLPFCPYRGLFRFLLFLRFRRTFFAPSAPPVTAPGQILFPVEFKTLRNTRIYFTGVPQRGRGGGAARFYSGSDEARKRNKEKMYTRSLRRKRRRRSSMQEGRRREGGRKEGRRREGSSKLLYLGPHRYSRDDPGAIIFPKLRPSISKPIFLFFLLFIFPPLPLPPSFTHCASPTFTIVTIVRLTSDG